MINTKNISVLFHTTAKLHTIHGFPAGIINLHSQLVCERKKNKQTISQSKHSDSSQSAINMLLTKKIAPCYQCRKQTISHTPPELTLSGTIPSGSTPIGLNCRNCYPNTTQTGSRHKLRLIYKTIANLLASNRSTRHITGLDRRWTTTETRWLIEFALKSN